MPKRLIDSLIVTKADSLPDSASTNSSPLSLVSSSHSQTVLILLFFAELAKLSLTEHELQWLRITCPYLKPRYLKYLSGYRFKPHQVQITFLPISADSEYGDLEIIATGLWVETIFWEVHLMACLSEIFFRTVDTDWSYEGQAGEQFSDME
jgi:nicotinic acid phosphoribosyltransferase